jgi:hypothetical protein
MRALRTGLATPIYVYEKKYGIRDPRGGGRAFGAGDGGAGGGGGDRPIGHSGRSPLKRNLVEMGGEADASRWDR